MMMTDSAFVKSVLITEISFVLRFLQTFLVCYLSYLIQSCNIKISSYVFIMTFLFFTVE